MPIFVHIFQFVKNIPPAVRFMLLSTLSFALMNALVKYLVHFPTFEIVFFRSLSSLLITTAILKTKKIPFKPNKRSLLIIRGIMGVTSMSLFFMSAHYISIGSAVTIRYIAPLFTALMAILFLKEKIFSLQWLFFIVAFIGVILIKGFDESVSVLGFSLAVGAAFTSAIVYIIISKIGYQDNPILIVHYFMGIATIVGALGMTFSWVQPSLIELSMLLFLGVLGYFGQIFMTKAFQSDEASKVAPIKYVEVLFTLSFGVYWFGEVYTILSLAGVFLVIFGLSANIIYKNKKT